MKLLMQQGSSSSEDAADDLAGRVQSLYARVAGKSKIEAQINYLESLRTWCPFYGSTLYEVQCQYDDNPLDPDSAPPVIAMNAWIGPLAIMLLTPTEPPIIMRHAYRRIIKWVTLPDKHIFTYWVLKPHVTLADLEEYQEMQRSGGKRSKRRGSNSDEDDDDDNISDQDGSDEDVPPAGDSDFDAQQFCDCVYLVTSQVRELDYLVKSYVESLTGTPPVLPGAKGELLPAKVATVASGSSRTRTTSEPGNTEGGGDADDEDAGEPEQTVKDGPPIPSAEGARKPKVGRLSLFFSSLGGTDGILGSSQGSGMVGDATDASVVGEDSFGDDTAAVSNSWFKNIYGGSGNGGNKKDAGGESSAAAKRGSVLEDEASAEEIAAKIPLNVKYAASMSELKRLAEETQFSDEEDDEDEDEDDEDEDEDEDDSSDGDGSDSDGDGETKPRKQRGKAKRPVSGDSSESAELDKKKLPGISSVKAFRRASKILFG